LVDSTIENQLRQILQQLGDLEESHLETGSKSDRLDVDKVLDTADRLDGPPSGS
jgi:predicted nuclease of predicted toxin-antitoxin system